MWLRDSERGPAWRGSCPVLALIGERDVRVLADGNIEAIRRALEAGGNEDFRAEVLPGFNHLFQTAETGAAAEYGKIDEIISPHAVALIGDWNVEHTRNSTLTPR
jgi:dienelactone hydrolase